MQTSSPCSVRTLSSKPPPNIIPTRYAPTWIAVGETELARIEHAHREPVRGDVLSGRDQVERERGGEQQHVVAFELQLRDCCRNCKPRQLAASATSRGACRGDRRTAPTGISAATGSVSTMPARLIVFSDCPRLPQHRRQDDREEPERQSLREVERDQQRDLLRAGHRGRRRL